MINVYFNHKYKTNRKIIILNSIGLMIDLVRCIETTTKKVWLNIFKVKKLKIFACFKKVSK